MGEVKICAIYGRESVLDENVEHGSLEQQRHMGLAVAESLTESSGIEHRVEFILIEEFGVSGKDQNRPKFQELLQLIRTNRINVIISKEVSRLTRSVSDFCEFMELCRKHGVAVKIKGLDVDPNTPMGGAMFQILAVVAQLEREMCRERVKSTLRSAMINNGKINGGPIILGFNRDPERKGFWIKNVQEIKQVIFLMQTFCETLSYKETVNAANDKRILNKNKRPFTKSSIRNLLTNKRYIGRQRVPRDDGIEEWIDLPFGAVVPVDLFDKVQACAELVTKKYGRNNKNQRRPYPLSGLLYHEDGTKFEVQSGTGKLGNVYCYYRNRKNRCTIDAHKLEQAVIQALRVFENDGRLIHHVNKIKNQQYSKLELVRQQTNQCTKQLSDLMKKEKQLVDQIGGGGVSNRIVSWLEKQLEDIESERLDLKARIQVLSREEALLQKSSLDVKTLGSSLKVLFDRLQSAEPEIQRGIFRQVFKKIIVKKGNKIEISWKVPSAVNHGGKNLVVGKKWLRWRDLNPRQGD